MDKKLANETLVRLYIQDYFIEIVTTQDVESGKTSSHIYRKALSYLQIEKQETLVFEDVYHALITAKNDGFIVMAVYDENEPMQIETLRISDYYITDF